MTATNALRPPIGYYGGKVGIAPEIVRLFGRHEHYVEPFGGSLAVLLAKPPAPVETVNDIDQALVTFWRVLRDRTDDLITAATFTPHSRAELDVARTGEAPDDLETARRVWVQLTQSRSSTLRRRAGWRHHVKADGRDSMTRRIRSYLHRLGPAAERLMAVTLESRPALDVIKRYGRDPDVLLYVDPPYLGSTRTTVTNYRHDMPNEIDHRDLAHALNACKAAVFVSSYGSPLYTELFRGWHSHRIPTGTTQGGQFSPRTEVIWSNRPIGDQRGLF